MRSTRPEKTEKKAKKHPTETTYIDDRGLQAFPKEGGTLRFVFLVEGEPRWGYIQFALNFPP